MKLYKIKRSSIAKVLILVGILGGIFFLPGKKSHAQTPTSPPSPTSASSPTDGPATELYRAKITSVETTTLPGSDSIPADTFFTQVIHFQLIKDRSEHQVQYGDPFQPLPKDQLLRENQTVIVQKNTFSDPTQAEGTEATELTTEVQYQIIDVYRLTPFVFLLFFFLVLVFLVARWQGMLSVVGMTASIIVLTTFLLPALIHGFDPLLISIVGSIMLAATTLYITHGWNASSHVAFLSIVGVLIVVGLLSYGSVLSMHLSGLGTEEALFLQFLSGTEIRLQGLLLGGILLGTLGVLDDIVVSQIAVVNELFGSKPKITFPELFGRSLRVGQTHVASLVNTLVLVYAGANLPLFLLFLQNPQPLWVTLNSELVMEEVVRTLAGSIGLVMAVPLTTFLAAAGLLFLPHIFEGSHFSTHKHHHHD